MQELRFRIRAMFFLVTLLAFFAIAVAALRISDDPRIGGVGLVSSMAFLMGFLSATLAIRFMHRAASIEQILNEARQSEYRDYS